MGALTGLLRHHLAGTYVYYLWGVVMKIITDSDRIQWLEDMNTLHGAVEILYVVDGYQLMHTYDDSQVMREVHGNTLAQAIDNAINSGWQPLNRRNKK